MNSTSKTLLSALIISLFSLATLQGYRVITQTGSTPQVLGDTTTANKAVPCDVINTWQKQYCSSVGYTTPTVAPTREPMGTPVPASQVNISQNGPCNGYSLNLTLNGNIYLNNNEKIYYGAIKDESTGKSVFYSSSNGTSGRNYIFYTLKGQTTNLFPNYETMYLIGDGRTYTFSFYSDFNQDRKIDITIDRLIYQTKFNYNCPGMATPTRAPMGTPVVIKATPTPSKPTPTRAPMGTPVVIKATPTLPSKPTPVIYN